jgi:uncharacterized membrane protein YbhN (UPF0104 family)
MMVVMLIGGARWSILLLEKPTIKDFWIFTKATYRGAFYSLIFPTSVAGDLFKWLPLQKSYPELSKTKIASSVVIDRIVGVTAFGITALLALIIGKILKYQFPEYFLWFFILLNVGILVFYMAVMLIDFEKILGRYNKLKKVLEILDLFKNENKKRILICLLISLIGEPFWQAPYWFYSLIFHTGISYLQVLIFMPIISLILILPISVAGFGARENLFLYFFGALGITDEKLLIMSAFAGIMGILNSLIGGLFLLF